MIRLIVVTLLFLVSATAHTSELEVRSQIHQSVAELFAAEDFAALEELANTYRVENSRTPSGLTRLGEFYVGFSTGALPFAKDDQEGWEEAALAFDRWREQYPSSPTPYVAKGAALMGRGWAYRGQGWIRGVERQDIRRFQEFAERAIEYLNQNSKVGKRDPHWYFVVADASGALGVKDADFLAIVNEGLDRYPNYHSIYIKAANYVAPKWHGSLREVEAFARSAVSRTKDVRGFELYTRIYWAASKGGSGQYAIQSPYATWTDLVQGMDDILAAYPDQWNINNFAFFGCLRSDSRTARRFLEMVDEPVPTSAWGYNEKNYHNCRRFAGLGPAPSVETSE